MIHKAIEPAPGGAADTIFWQHHRAWASCRDKWEADPDRSDERNAWWEQRHSPLFERMLSEPVCTVDAVLAKWDASGGEEITLANGPFPHSKAAIHADLQAIREGEALRTGSSAELLTSLQEQFDAVDSLTDDIDNLAALVVGLTHGEGIDWPERQALHAIAYHLERLRDDSCRISNTLWPLAGAGRSD